MPKDESRKLSRFWSEGEGEGQVKAAVCVKKVVVTVSQAIFSPILGDSQFPRGENISRLFLKILDLQLEMFLRWLQFPNSALLDRYFAE